MKRTLERIGAAWQRYIAPRDELIASRNHWEGACRDLEMHAATLSRAKNEADRALKEASRVLLTTEAKLDGAIVELRLQRREKLTISAELAQVRNKLANYRNAKENPAA